MTENIQNNSNLAKERLSSLEIRNHYLSEKRAELKKLSEKNKELLVLKQKLDQVEAEIKKRELQEVEILRRENLVEEKQLKNKLKEISQENWKIEQSIMKELKQEETILKNNMKIFVNQQLRQLREQIITELPNLPMDIKQCFLQGDYLTIMQKSNALKRDIDQLENFLYRAHSKYGCQSLEQLNTAFTQYENSLNIMD